MFNFPNDLQQALTEAAEDFEKRQIAQTRVLSKILKELQSISADTCGARLERSEIVNLLCSIGSDTHDLAEHFSFAAAKRLKIEKEDS